MGKKSFDLELRERVRLLLEKIVDEEFDGNRTQAAKALGVSQSYVTELLKASRGVGPTILVSIADRARVSIDELMGRQRFDAPLDSDEPRYSNLPGWHENEPEARRQTGYPEWVFVRARRMRGLVPPAGATVKFIVDAADSVMKHMPMSEKVEETNRQLENELKRIEGRAAKRTRGKK